MDHDRADLPEDQKEELRRIVESQDCLLASPYPLSNPVVASAWGKQLRLKSVDDPKLQEFILAYRKGPQTPEPGAPCTGTAERNPRPKDKDRSDLAHAEYRSLSHIGQFQNSGDLDIRVEDRVLRCTFSDELDMTGAPVDANQARVALDAAEQAIQWLNAIVCNTLACTNSLAQGQKQKVT